MTEKEVRDALEKAGYDEEGIISSIWAYHKTKENFPDLTFEEWLEFAIKAHERVKNDTDDFITVD